MVSKNNYINPIKKTNFKNKLRNTNLPFFKFYFSLYIKNKYRDTLISNKKNELDEEENILKELENKKSDYNKISNEFQIVSLNNENLKKEILKLEEDNKKFIIINNKNKYKIEEKLKINNYKKIELDKEIIDLENENALFIDPQKNNITPTKEIKFDKITNFLLPLGINNTYTFYKGTIGKYPAATFNPAYKINFQKNNNNGLTISTVDYSLYKKISKN